MSDVKIIPVQRCEDCPYYSFRSASMVFDVNEAGKYCTKGSFKLEGIGKVVDHVEIFIDKRCPLPDMPL